MSMKEWKRRMLKKEYHELKQEQTLRKAVQSALVCRREETGGIMEELQADLDKLETVFHQLMGRSARDGGDTAGSSDRKEPLGQLWQIMQHLGELHDQLKEMTDREEQLVRELNMERERIADEVESVSEQISGFNARHCSEADAE